MRTSLKNLRKVIEQVEFNIKEGKEIEQSKEKLALLKDILGFVEGFTWLKHGDYKEKIKTFWYSKLNYNVLMEQYCLSADSAKMTVLYANDRLRMRIGENTLDMIIEGSVDAARKQFLALSGHIKVEDCILSEAFAKLPKKGSKPVDLKDCETEIRFLADYSKAMMIKRVQELDKDKLSYLQYVISGGSETQTEEMIDLVQLLNGYITYADYEKKQCYSIL